MEMQIRLKCFFISNYKNLQEEFFLQTQDLAASLSSMSFPQHDPIIRKHLPHNLVLGCVREYVRTIHVLAPLSLAPTSFDTTSTFTALHLESNGYFLLFLEDYKPNQNLELFPNSFKLVFQCMSHLLASGLFGMIF